jgi:medium-chain acyl-[acyl-carrier-protein] hydrolase
MKTTLTRNSWVKCPKPNPKAQLRLFCFPYAGGWSLSFRTWPDNLPTTVEVCPIELPGRGTRLSEAPLTRLEPLIEKLTQALLPYLDRPFAFFGHSMGGLVCFQLARFLRQNYGLIPSHLFVSGRGAPHFPRQEPPIHGLPEPDFLEELRRLNGTPEAVLAHLELRSLLLPALRADFAILETYVYTPAPPLDCPITAFGGLQDLEVTCEKLEAWRVQTSASFSLQMIPGDHFFLHSAETFLCQLLSQELQNYVVR